MSFFLPLPLIPAEIDVITPRRDTASKEMERRIVAQLLSSLDDLQEQLPVGAPPVVVLGATNRPDAIDPALRRAGRFDREFALNVPGLAAREQILRVLCQPLRLEEDLDFAVLARSTPGYVGADLKALVTEAGLSAMTRAFGVLQANGVQQPMEIDDGVDGPLRGSRFTAEQLVHVKVTMEDFTLATKR
jgi:ribosome biogenesis ATPase